MDIEFDEIDAVNAVPSGNGKMMLVYQSKEMKNMYERYGNHMQPARCDLQDHKVCIPVVLRRCTDKCKFSGVLCNSSTRGID